MSRTRSSVPDDAEGTDFLNTDFSSVKNTHEIKDAVNNVIGHHGGEKPKQRTAEYRAMLRNEMLNILVMAARLTKNSEQAVACCVDIATIRNYDLKGKDYELPPYHVGEGRANTLHAEFINMVGEQYHKYLQMAEDDFEKHNNVGAFMTATSWKKTLEPLLAEITRFCIKFWHLHPHYNRLEALNAALDTFESDFQRKGDCKRIIDYLISQRKLKALKEEVLALEMETVDQDGSPSKVFKENDTAQTVITQFLTQIRFKWNRKETLDALCPLQDYIQNLEEGDGDKDLFSKFEEMVPRKTAAYMERFKKKQKQEEAKEKKRQAHEAKLAEMEAAKRQKIEERKKELENEELERQKKEEERKKEAEEKKEGEPTDPNAEDEDDFNEKDKTVKETEKEKEAKENAARKKKALQELEGDDEFAELKLTAAYYEVFEQSTVTRKAKSARQEAHQSGLRISKHLLNLTDDLQQVVVAYIKPGSAWQKGIMQRLSNCISAVNLFGVEEPDIVQGIFPSNETEDDTQVSWAKGGRVVLAIMMHQHAKKDEDIKRMYLHPGLLESIFLGDLADTTELWLPNLFESCINTLACLHDLICSTQQVGGESRKGRVSLFYEFLKDKNQIPVGKGQQVEEITSLFRVIADHFDLGKKEETRDIEFDPFDVQNMIYEDEEDKLQVNVPSNETSES